jgi:hypothetical protein
MSKGDYITVAIRGLEGPWKTEASQNGRTVKHSFNTESGVKWLVIQEITRGGTVIQESRYPADQVLVMNMKVKGGPE